MGEIYLVCLLDLDTTISRVMLQISAVRDIDFFSEHCQRISWLIFSLSKSSLAFFIYMTTFTINNIISNKHRLYLPEVVVSWKTMVSPSVRQHRHCKHHFSRFWYGMPWTKNALYVYHTISIYREFQLYYFFIL